MDPDDYGEYKASPSLRAWINGKEKPKLSEWERFHELLKDKAKELCPDYPSIETEENPWTLFAAITGSLEGTCMANDDLHKIIEAMREKLGMSKMDVVELGRIVAPI